MVGIEEDAYRLPLTKNQALGAVFRVPKSTAPAIDLEGWLEDAKRLTQLEIEADEIHNKHVDLEEQVDRLLPQLKALRKETLDLKEQNALIKERLRLLKVQIEEKKRSCDELRAEADRLEGEKEQKRLRIEELLAQLKGRQQQRSGDRLQRQSAMGQTAKVQPYSGALTRTWIPRTAERHIIDAPEQVQRKVVQKTRPASTYHPQTIAGEIIRSREEENFLKSQIRSITGKQPGLSLIYKGSFHGDGAKDFHDNCDGKESTLVLIETEDLDKYSEGDFSRRFGAFVRSDWATSGSTNGGFVFSLDEQRILGGGNSKSNRGGPTIEGSFMIPDRYQTSGGQAQDQTLVGANTFPVHDVEVYEII